VLVVGGGPAGSTVSALLAQDGLDVVVLEKDPHPRFHIGESLLPRNMPLLEKLGVLDEVAKIGMPKYGITFDSPWHNKTIEYRFAKALDKSLPMAYQVRRSVFDQLLFKNAAAKGAKMFEGVCAREVEFLPEGGARVSVSGPEGKSVWRTRYLVDTTGRDTLLANKFGIKRSNLRHATAAIFGHFTNAKRLTGDAEGHISIFWFDHGWFWFIPLADNTTSVGAVCNPDYINSRKTDTTSFLHATIALCPALGERLKDATLMEPATATGNYSYMCDRMSGPSYLLLGDAFAFVDPVFSTGVYLAMSSAFMGADVVKAALADPKRGAAAAARAEAEMRRAIATFSWYIYRMTRPAFRDLFMGPRNVLRVEEAMMSLLAGDVFRKTSLRARLAVFQSIYYAKTLGYWLRGKPSVPMAASR
jgi:flavin-dependent dehydrogenase